MRRHRGLTLTAVITMTASLLVLGVFLVTSYNVQSVLRGLENRKEVVVYLNDGLTPTDLEMVKSRLEMHPAVEGVRFVSREEAWDEFAREMNIEGLQESLGGNPLPDAYRLVLDPERREAETIFAMEREIAVWDEVDEVIAGGDWVGRLDSFAQSVLWFTLAIGLAVGLSIVAIVSNTVRLTVVARQDLIHIMRVVGASEGFIRIPFLSEGVMQALIAGVLALGGLYAATLLIADRVAGVSFLSPLWCLGFLLLAVTLGLVGSAFSVRHVLRKVHL